MPIINIWDSFNNEVNGGTLQEVTDSTGSVTIGSPICTNCTVTSPQNISIDCVNNNPATQIVRYFRYIPAISTCGNNSPIVASISGYVTPRPSNTLATVCRDCTGGSFGTMYINTNVQKVNCTGAYGPTPNNGIVNYRINTGISGQTFPNTGWLTGTIVNNILVIPASTLSTFTFTTADLAENVFHEIELKNAGTSLNCTGSQFFSINNLNNCISNFTAPSICVNPGSTVSLNTLLGVLSSNIPATIGLTTETGSFATTTTSINWSTSTPNVTFLGGTNVLLGTQSPYNPALIFGSGYNATTLTITATLVVQYTIGTDIFTCTDTSTITIPTTAPSAKTYTAKIVPFNNGSFSCGATSASVSVHPVTNSPQYAFSYYATLSNGSTCEQTITVTNIFPPLPSGSGQQALGRRLAIRNYVPYTAGQVISGIRLPVANGGSISKEEKSGAAFGLPISGSSTSVASALEFRIASIYALSQGSNVSGAGTNASVWNGNLFDSVLSGIAFPATTSASFSTNSGGSTSTDHIILATNSRHLPTSSWYGAGNVGNTLELLINGVWVNTSTVVIQTNGGSYSAPNHTFSKCSSTIGITLGSSINIPLASYISLATANLNNLSVSPSANNVTLTSSTPIGSVASATCASC